MVTSSVINKIATGAETSVASLMLTLIWFLPSVCPHMYPKVSILVKDFAASSMRADKSEWNIRVGILHMYLKSITPSKLSFTDRALMQISWKLGVGIFDHFRLVRMLGLRLTLKIIKIQLLREVSLSHDNLRMKLV